MLMRALGFSSQEILEMFFDNDTFHVTEDGYQLELIASRLRGETARFEIADQKGNVIVEEGARITARHIRDMETANLDVLNVPVEYVCTRTLAEDIIDEEAGGVVRCVQRQACRGSSRQNQGNRSRELSGHLHQRSGLWSVHLGGYAERRPDHQSP
ncbi:MAG: hypothetical protein U5O39_02965 [Gammaproteobacteria bacterium]|nr:hypothetical protein [Gammaproteobacteria bacterium]